MIQTKTGFQVKPIESTLLKPSKIEIGRYNWKANAPTVKYQVAAAMSNDMGLTSPLYPAESCTSSQERVFSQSKRQRTHLMFP